MDNNNLESLTDIYRLLGLTSKSETLGELITSNKNSLDISNRQLSVILNIPYTTLDRIIKNIENNDLKDVDFDLLLKLTQFTGIGIDEMAKAYVASLSPDKIREIENARKANYILRNFDIKLLKKTGFLNTISDFSEIEKRIKTFFGLESIFHYNTEVGGVFFSRTKNVSADKMREFWVRSAIFQFQKINNENQYNRENLLSIIPKIRPYTRYEEKGFLTVIKALYNIGVTVIVQSYLSKTQVRGGTFVVNNRPCVVITDYNKTYSTLWFALMHELYHVINDFEDLQSYKYHLTGEEQSELHLFREDLADYFACEMLFPEENLQYIQNFIKSPLIVNNYAEKHNVHPSIIYSFYCYDQDKKGNKYYGAFSQFFGKSDKALKLLKTQPWTNETIYEGIDEQKKILVLQN